jgi:hypothetical protein
MCLKKGNVKEKHSCLLWDVKQWMDDIVKHTMEQNYAKLKKGVDDYKNELWKMEKVRDFLLEEKKIRNDEKKSEEEKKKLKFTLFDLLEASAFI